MSINIIIIVCAVLLILALVTPLLNIFFRKVEISNTQAKSTSLPDVSILLTAFGHSEHLENHLTNYLTQDYDGEYEVIVVAEKGDADTEDILKRHECDPRLYITFIPESSRYMSRKKLSITLGVKAAKYEWIIMAEPSLNPDSECWLKTMAANLTDEENMVLGYSRYDAATPDYYRFEHFHTAYYLMRKAIKGTAYRTNMPYIAFRKSEFLKENGFQGNLKYLRGEYDFMVNKYARKGITVVETNPNAWMTESCPTKKNWRNKLIYYQETKKHLKRKFIPNFIFPFEQAMMYLNYIAILLAAIFAIITKEWIIGIMTSVAFIITICLRTMIAKKATSRFLLDIPTWKLIFYELRLPWTYIHAKIRYKKADKYDFISHKL